jgi:hypothetical protein
MSPRAEDFPDRDPAISIGDGEDFILVRLTEDGQVTTVSSLDEDDAVDLLRDTADAIEREGFDRQKMARLS